MVTDEKGQQASKPASKPASQQANYTKHKALGANSGRHPQNAALGDGHWVWRWFFRGALCLICGWWGVWVDSSHESKQQNTLFHAFARRFYAEVVELSFLKLFSRYVKFSFELKLQHFRWTELSIVATFASVFSGSFGLKPTISDNISCSFSSKHAEIW